MSTEEIQFRNAAAVTGIPLDDVERGTWNTNPELKPKMLEALEDIDKRNKNIFHYSVGNKDIDEVISIAKRWYWKHVGRGNDCLVIYDYLKLTGEKISNNWAEYQVIGEKTDKMKKLAEELQCPIFTAIQINRSGENIGKKKDGVTDDSSVIAQSDRVMWFITVLAIFRQKVLEEVVADGNEFGTHKLIPLKRRYLGKKAKGHKEFIHIVNSEGKPALAKNFINYEIENFEVIEKGTLADISKANELKVNALPDAEQAEEEVFR
jgi:replicative DNA helicase